NGVCSAALLTMTRHDTRASLLSLPDALPISSAPTRALTLVPPQPVGTITDHEAASVVRVAPVTATRIDPHHAGSLVIGDRAHRLDRKSTRLNSSHVAIPHAVRRVKKKTVGDF